MYTNCAGFKTSKCVQPQIKSITYVYMILNGMILNGKGDRTVHGLKGYSLVSFHIYICMYELVHAVMWYVMMSGNIFG